MCSTNLPVFRLVTMALCCFALLLGASAGMSAVVTTEQIQCIYDPDSGQQNPFGSHAFITVTQNGADTTFRYEQFANVVQLPSLKDRPNPGVVTVESTRTMIFYHTPIEMAREMMRLRSDYYYELIGYVDSIGFAAYDEVMTCE